MISRYLPNQDYPVEAAKWDGSKTQAGIIVEWIMCNGYFAKHVAVTSLEEHRYIYVDTDGGPLTIAPGDYLVLTAAGPQQYTEEKFERMYSPLPEMSDVLDEYNYAVRVDSSGDEWYHYGYGHWHDTNPEEADGCYYTECNYSLAKVNQLYGPIRFK